MSNPMPSVHLNLSWLALLAALIFIGTESYGIAQESQSGNKPAFDARVFDDSNLVAWCIVPFDSEKRTPAQRADMLDELGIRKFAYDYRAEHIATFEEEIQTLAQHGIELTAWWFPSVLNEEARGILDLLKKHDTHPQLWVTGGGDPAMSSEQEAVFVDSEVLRLREIADAAHKVGCRVALYNHGGWFGEPKNLVRLVRAIDRPNVGVVYNLHHAHDQLEQLEANLKLLNPYLLAINLNGMQTDGERLGQKILTIGAGDRDREVLRIIGQSGFKGPIGILNHTDLDARQRLSDNLTGLRALVLELKSSP